MKNLDYIKRKTALIHGEISDLMTMQNEPQVVGMQGKREQMLALKKWQLGEIQSMAKEHEAILRFKRRYNWDRMCDECKHNFREGLISCHIDVRRFIFCSMSDRVIA